MIRGPSTPHYQKVMMGTYSPGLASPILIMEKIVSHAIKYYYHINEKLMFFICFMYLGAVSFYYR